MGKNHYYNEQVEKAKAVKYLSLGDEEFRLSDPYAIKLKHEIITGAIPIVNGIVYTHKFHRFEPYDDCFQEGLAACVKALEKFNPNYIIKKTGQPVKLFNYFSLTAKGAMKYYTMRGYKHRLTSDADDPAIVQIEAPEMRINFNLDYVDKIVDYIRPLLKGVKRNMCLDVFHEYMYARYGEFNRRDFMSYVRRNYPDIKPNIIRLTLKQIQDEKEKIKEIVL
jgi:hypothetical protein